MPMTPRRLLPMLLAAAACSGDGAQWTGTVRDSAGIAIVENPVDGIWEEGDAPTITRELDIGTADGPPETQFGNIAGITSDSEGRIYVLDQQAKRVRVFGPDGAFVREMGGEGTGPGELSQFAGGLLRLAGDTIVVPDMMQQRVNRYAPDGTSAGSFPMMMMDGVPVRWDVTPDHRMVHQTRRIPMGAAPGAAEQPAPGTTGDPIVVRGLDGSILDTLAVLPPGMTMSMSGGQMRMKLFSSEPVWDLGPEGRLYTAVNDDYRIHVWSPDGELERIITRPFEQRPITETDQRDIKAALREMMVRTTGAPAAQIEPAIQMMEFADRFPAFSQLLAAPNGQLWVQRVRTPESIAAAGGSFDLTDLGAKEWDVFDGEGRYLGMLELPDRFVPTHVDGNDIYGIWRDDLDVQHVVRLRVN